MLLKGVVCVIEAGAKLNQRNSKGQALGTAEGVKCQGLNSARKLKGKAASANSGRTNSLDCLGFALFDHGKR